MRQSRGKGKFSEKKKTSSRVATRVRSTKLPIKESQIQKAVMKYLEAKGISAIRLNNIPVPLKSGGFRPVAKRGLADCHVDLVIQGVPVSLWIEFKTEKGKLSPYQEEFRDSVHHYGGFYEVIRSIDDMEVAITKINDEVCDRISLTA
tara:strand:- start:11992 stop:12435 length:444 start_codon:yes stop_codon:yes gene_type:complete